jgi:uroporphyrinogen-III synthase
VSNPENPLPLHRRTIAVPENRSLDLFARLLEQRGAEVLRCPLVDILDAPDPAPVLDWLRHFSAGGCDDLILLTGEGLRRLVSCLERHAPELRDSFIAQLGRTRLLTRGPKPAAALRELGIKPQLAADPHTTAGVIATLSRLDLHGRRVGVQLYGTEPNLPLMEFLRGAGAEVSTVAPYVYADAAADEQVRTLIARLAEGGVDAIAFTSQGQVERLFKLAKANSLEDRLRTGLSRTAVAAVGPLVAEALRARGAKVDLMPEDAHFLKPLTQALVQALGRSRG